MLRVVFSVTLAVALVAASTPAIERARIDTAETHIQRQLSTLLDTAERLRAGSDPVPPTTPGARQYVTLTLGKATWGRAGVQQVTIGDGEIVWQVDGGTRHVHRTERPLLGRGGAGPLVLTERASVHLELRLVRMGGRETVAIRRTFISDGAARRGHAEPLRPGEEDGQRLSL